MYLNNRNLDIKSRGEITDYLQILLKKGQIKDCQCLKIEEGHLHTFKTECTKQFASRISAVNVHTDPSAGGAPSSYFWPKCPKDCPYYSKSEDFIHSLNNEVEEFSSYKSTYEDYVNFSRIQELKDLKKKGSNQFDLTKLIEICEELNKCYSNKCFLSVGMLLRSILDHVPPIFGKQNFIEVTNNYKGKSFMKSMKHLQENSRDISDRFLHNINLQEVFLSSHHQDY